jgi:hypothetical protein
MAARTIAVAGVIVATVMVIVTVGNGRDNNAAVGARNGANSSAAVAARMATGVMAGAAPATAPTAGTIADDGLIAAGRWSR